MRLLTVFLILIGISFFFFDQAFAQEKGRLIPSLEKVTIDGKPLYLHVVEAGHTLYSISRAYNLPEHEVAEANPGCMEGLKPGQSLKIPVVEGRNGTLEEIQAASLYQYHTIESGQTLLLISRMYGMDPEDISNSNPKVGRKLQAGRVLRIPKGKIKQGNGDHSPETELSDPQGKKEPENSHTVSTGETFFSIARMYQVSVEALQQANPQADSRLLKPGMELIIPTQRLNTMPEPSSPLSITSPKKDDPALDSLPQGKGKMMRVAVFLPLFLAINDTLGQSDTIPVFSPDGMPLEKWPVVFGKSENFLDFYEGILLSVSHLKEKGLSVELLVFDAPRDTVLLKRNLKKENFSKIDLIIGPVYSNEFAIAARFAMEMHIPIISPLSAKTDGIISNPYMIQAVPSNDFQEIFFANFLASQPNANLILLQNAQKTEPEAKRFKKSLLKAFGYTAGQDSLAFKEVLLSQEKAPEKLRGTDKEKHVIGKWLLSGKENYVVLLSVDQAYVTNLIGQLKTYAEGLDTSLSFSVCGFSTWQRFENINLDFFHQLEMRTFSTTYVDYSSEDVKGFVREFRIVFQNEPSEFAFQGYDIFSWFGHLFMESNADLLTAISKGEQPPFSCLQNDYSFVQSRSGSGFINQSVRIIRFTKDFQIRRIPYSAISSKAKLFMPN